MHAGRSESGEGSMCGIEGCRLHRRRHPGASARRDEDARCGKDALAPRIFSRMAAVVPVPDPEGQMADSARPRRAKVTTMAGLEGSCKGRFQFVSSKASLSVQKVLNSVGAFHRLY
jgi:hypothetical protein